MLPGLFLYVGEHRCLAIRRPAIGISVHAEVDGLNEASMPKLLHRTSDLTIRNAMPTGYLFSVTCQGVRDLLKYNSPLYSQPLSMAPTPTVKSAEIFCV